MQGARRQARRGAPVTERRRVPIGIRVTPEMRDKLVERSGAKGRSITQEIELLLEQALFMEWLRLGCRAPELWHDVISRADAKGSSRAAQLGIDGDWSGDQECFTDAMMSAIVRLLERLPGVWDENYMRKLHELLE